MGTAARNFTSWLTGIDGCEHAITDQEATRTINSGDGIYRAICDQRVVAAPLTEPPGRRCSSCVQLVRAAVTGTRQQPRHMRRTGWIRRLFGRKAPAAAENPAPSGTSTHWTSDDT
jgi:hypothetical protein